MFNTAPNTVHIAAVVWSFKTPQRNLRIHLQGLFKTVVSGVTEKEGRSNHIPLFSVVDSGTDCIINGILEYYCH